MQSKTKKAFRNVLAFLTVLTMMLGMLPTTLLAANTDDSGTAGESGMHLSKTARLEDDGTYTINLEAYATGKTTTTITKEAVPLDIVLVLDQSGGGQFPDNKISSEQIPAPVFSLCCKEKNLHTSYKMEETCHNTWTGSCFVIIYNILCRIFSSVRFSPECLSECGVSV